MGLSVAIGLGIGVALDAWLPWSPLGLLLGLGWGCVAAGHQIWRLIRESP